MSARRSRFAIAADTLGRLSLAERLLLALSKHPAGVDPTAHFAKPDSAYKGERVLALLRRAFPDFDSHVVGRDVLDFGCGDGFQSAAMAELGARSVLGVDVAERRLESARTLTAAFDNVSFDTSIGERRFDLIVSQDAFEHLSDPVGCLAQWKAALRPGGRVLMSFGPPWFAPYGAHMYFFTDLPWLNLLFGEATVMRVRSVYRADGRTHYEQGLNRMSIRRFERLIAASGLSLRAHRYHCPGGARWLSRVPWLRELFISQVDAALELAGTTRG